MELCEGGELFDRIVRARRLSERAASRYFRQLMIGVQYLHENGICHRDLKPENLLLTSSDDLRISNFGLAAVGRVGTPQNGTIKLLQTCCGTPNYVAPEILRQGILKGYDGFLSDVWSCGVVLYAMLAGYLPFEHPSMAGLFRQIKSGNFTFPSHFAKAARRVINKMIKVDLNERHHPKEILQDPWVAGLPWIGRTLGPGHVIRREARSAGGDDKAEVQRHVGKKMSSSPPPPAAVASSEADVVEQEGPSIGRRVDSVSSGPYGSGKHDKNIVPQSFEVRGSEAFVLKEITSALLSLDGVDVIPVSGTAETALECLATRKKVAVRFWLDVKLIGDLGDGVRAVQVRRGKWAEEENQVVREVQEELLAVLSRWGIR